MSARSAAPLPWWVLPAVFAAGAVGALLARWTFPAPLVETATAIAPAQGLAALQAPSQAAPAPAASARPASPAVEMSGVVLIEGRPALALVAVDGAPATLRRPGDALGHGTVLLRVAAEGLVLSDGPRERHVRLTGPVTVVADAPQPAALAAMPPPPGTFALPALDEPAGSGNAAFRAAIEERVRALRR